VESRFRGIFGTDAHIFRAPCRVNLIGEHTDYKDGFVMPAGIGFCTWVAAAKREDRRLEAHSDRFGEKISFSLDALSGTRQGIERFHSWGRRDIAGSSKRPDRRQSGDSRGTSSWCRTLLFVSLEVATALALTSLSEITLPRPELAKLCQAAEHEFVGNRCGIMDQFSVSLGIVGQALMLDCRSLDYRLLAIPPNLRVVVLQQHGPTRAGIGRVVLVNSEVFEANGTADAMPRW
jgi:galactokinase